MGAYEMQFLRDLQAASNWVGRVKSQSSDITTTPEAHMYRCAFRLMNVWTIGSRNDGGTESATMIMTAEPSSLRSKLPSKSQGGPDSRL